MPKTRIHSSMRTTATLQCSLGFNSDALKLHQRAMAAVDLANRRSTAVAVLREEIEGILAGLGAQMRDLLRKNEAAHRAIETRSYADEVEA